MASTTNSTNDYKLYYLNTLIALFLFSIIAGFFGFQRYYLQQGESFTWIRSIYCSLQLFAFEGGDLRGHIPWELQAARFIAPLTAVMAFIIATMEIFKERWNVIKISRMKNHVVIIGLGTKGKNIMEESLRKGEKVLVIESDQSNPNIASIKSSRCKLLLSNANNKSILNKVGITKAKSVFLLMGDDTQQVSACLHIYHLIINSNRNESNPLNCIMHLKDQDLLNTIRNHNLVRDTRDGFALSVFNLYENSARELFEYSPPDYSGITIKSEKYVQIIIFGFGQAGETLALQTALNAHYINGKKTKVLIIDRLAKQKIPEFLERYPTYVDYCELQYVSLDINNYQIIEKLDYHLNQPEALNTMVLCFDNKTQNILFGLQLENILLKEVTNKTQIFIRTNDNESFNSFSQNLRVYGLPSNVCSIDVIIGGKLDKKAKAIHSQYLESRKNEGAFGSRVADVSWENLSQEYKKSNRNSADHINIKLKGIGCEIVSENDPRSSAVFKEDEIEMLAELEHRRWNAERSLAGWTYGNQKNTKLRQTPYLTDWNKLDEEIKNYDRDTVTNIQQILTLVGMKAVRKKVNEELIEE